MSSNHVMKHPAGFRGRAPGAEIGDARTCFHCGYDLRGLSEGGVCPECGHTIVERVRVLRQDVLGDAPRWYLSGFIGGCLLSAISGITTVWSGVFWGGSVLAATGTGTAGMEWLIQAVMWYSGVVLMLRQRPGSSVVRELDERGREWFGLRCWVWGTQAAVFPLVYVRLMMSAAAAAPAPGPGATGWAVAVGALTIVMFLGWPGLCFYMTRIAEWARDDPLAGAWRLCGTVMLGTACLSVLGMLIGLVPGLQLLAVMSSVLLLAVPLAFVFQNVLLVWMSVMVCWAMRNSEERLARDERMARRARERSEQMSARSAGGLSALPRAHVVDEGLLRSVEEASERAGVGGSEAELEQQKRALLKQGNVVMPKGDGGGYELEKERG